MAIFLSDRILQLRLAGCQFHFVSRENAPRLRPARRAQLRELRLRETPKGPYVNLVAVRSVDRDKPWVRALVDSYRSDQVKAFILATFDGAVLPSW